MTWLLERLGRDAALARRVAGAAGHRGDPASDAIVRESLRLRPPAIAALRRLRAPRTIAGHALPAGVTVMLPIPLLHRDARAHAAPDAFVPERWLGAAPPSAFWPFGAGARRCVGELLAYEYLATIPPVVLSRRLLRPVWPRPERAVLRGTILVPHRGAAVVAAHPSASEPVSRPARGGKRRVP